MNYHFETSQIKALSELVQKYLITLSSPIDSFLEDHILGSQFYTIVGQGKLMGYLALHEQKLLTQFYIEPEFLSQGQVIFRQLLSQSQPEAAFVPTCDELFLSHALDQEVSVKKQAYFFQDCREIEVESKIYQSGQFRLPERDKAAQRQLQAMQPEIPWEATNQAAVHLWYEAVFGDAVSPLTSTLDAIGTWPETVTCIGVRLQPDDTFLIAAPYGLADLFNLILRRNPRRVSLERFQQRVREKRILKKWPQVHLSD